MPVAMFEFTITNSSEVAVDYALFGCLAFPFENADVAISQDNGVTRISGTSRAEKRSVEYGELCIACDQPDISHQRHLFRGSWFDMMEVYWQDITRSGPLKDRFYAPGYRAWERGPRAPFEHSVLASHFRLDAGQSRRVRYLIAWFVPNTTKYWNSSFTLRCRRRERTQDRWSNYYASQWSSAVEVALEAFERWDEAASRTIKFQVHPQRTRRCQCP